MQKCPDCIIVKRFTDLVLGCVLLSGALTIVEIMMCDHWCEAGGQPFSILFNNNKLDIKCKSYYGSYRPQFHQTKYFILKGFPSFPSFVSFHLFTSATTDHISQISTVEFNRKMIFVESVFSVSSLSRTGALLHQSDWSKRDRNVEENRALVQRNRLSQQNQVRNKQGQKQAVKQ